MSQITNDRLNPVWHRMPYSCTRMATLGVKGLKPNWSRPTYVVYRSLSHHDNSPCRSVSRYLRRLCPTDAYSASVVVVKSISYQAYSSIYIYTTGQATAHIRDDWTLRVRCIGFVTPMKLRIRTSHRILQRRSHRQ